MMHDSSCGCETCMRFNPQRFLKVDVKSQPEAVCGTCGGAGFLGFYRGPTDCPDCHGTGKVKWEK